jgi:hypothetical protein
MELTSGLDAMVKGTHGPAEKPDRPARIQVSVSAVIRHREIID